MARHEFYRSPMGLGTSAGKSWAAITAKTQPIIGDDMPPVEPAEAAKAREAVLDGIKDLEGKSLQSFIAVQKRNLFEALESEDLPLDVMQKVQALKEQDAKGELSLEELLNDITSIFT